MLCRLCHFTVFLAVGVGVASDEYPRGKALCAVFCPFGSPCFSSHVHLYPLRAVGGGIVIVVCVELSLGSAFVLQGYADSTVQVSSGNVAKDVLSRTFWFLCVSGGVEDVVRVGVAPVCAQA